MKGIVALAAYLISLLPFLALLWIGSRLHAIVFELKLIRKQLEESQL
ncbi:hypothetical protein CMUST_09340 [Corynebacterium mustelae]|uniref:Uncharacterized protein n=1 Tax=Corynebacterium mustelae TaxID=571915 RepID=A0A0G3GYH6_9CORY|nr:hypothetical protein CMUST_09340 [Corynebacterium mustelae]